MPSSALRTAAVPGILVAVLGLAVLTGCQSKEPPKTVDDSKIKMPTPDARGFVPGVSKPPDDIPTPPAKK